MKNKNRTGHIATIFTHKRKKKITKRNAGHAPLEHALLLFGVEGPVLVHVVPYVPAEVVAVVLERADLGQDLVHLGAVLLLDALCNAPGFSTRWGWVRNLGGWGCKGWRHSPLLSLAYSSGFLKGLSASNCISLSLRTDKTIVSMCLAFVNVECGESIILSLNWGHNEFTKRRHRVSFFLFIIKQSYETDKACWWQATKLLISAQHNFVLGLRRLITTQRHRTSLASRCTRHPDI